MENKNSSNQETQLQGGIKEENNLSEEKVKELDKKYLVGQEKNSNLERERVAKLLMKNAGKLPSLTGGSGMFKNDPSNSILIKEPNTWNENAGVITFRSDSNEVYVTKANPELRKYLNESGSGYTKDESIGVPGVNDGSLWGNFDAYKNFRKEWDQN